MKQWVRVIVRMRIFQLVFLSFDGHPAHLVKAHPVDVHLELRAYPLLQYPSVDAELPTMRTLHGGHCHLFRYFN